jgi:hypothetical protein
LPISARRSTAARSSSDEVRDLCTAKGASIAFLINGRIFDMDRIDLVSVAGRVEEWDIFNNRQCRIRSTSTAPNSR